MTRLFRVQRVQESVVNVDDYQIEPGEDPAAVALELVEAHAEWDTVNTTVEAL